MKLEQQVTSLKLSKKLKELGVKQESLFLWFRYWKFPKVEEPSYEKREDWISVENELYYKSDKFKDPTGYNKLIASAFTVAELGEMLPRTFPPFAAEIRLDCRKEHSGWTCYYRMLTENDKIYWAESGDTEANARAKMLFYLKKKELI